MKSGYYKLYQPKNAKTEFFIDRILPWIILVSICFGIYLMLYYIIEASVIISEPLSKMLP